MATAAGSNPTFNRLAISLASSRCPAVNTTTVYFVAVPALPVAPTVKPADCSVEAAVEAALAPP